jgi:uncharacterized NAD(P)/FAD-binding protein YdhS
MTSHSATNDTHAVKVVICGGGASAVLLLCALKERTSRPLAVTVLEPREQLGAGVAYSTRSAAHVLNTRACNMAAGGGDADFLFWLRSERDRRGFNWGAEDFAPRQYYGEYLQSRLREVHSAKNIKLTWLRRTAQDVLASAEGWHVRPAQGAMLPADIVVFATGNEPPAPLGNDLPASAQRLVLNNPWRTEALNSLPRTAAVLVAGTGLTAVDATAELLHGRHTGPIYAFSRRGLLPRAHGAALEVPESLRASLPTSLRALVKRVRELCGEEARSERWRGVLTELRSVAPHIWGAWDLEERRRFLRHVRPFWDAHRHRLAPEVHAKLHRAFSRGQLTVVRGRLESLEHVGARGTLRATLRRGGASAAVLEGAVLINCTGPATDVRRSNNPLLRSIVADGLARPDALSLGLLTDERFRLLSRDGVVQRTLYALGTLARASQWELTAVPEIREQARLVARDIELYATVRAQRAAEERAVHPSSVQMAL